MMIAGLIEESEVQTIYLCWLISDGQRFTFGLLYRSSDGRLLTRATARYSNGAYDKAVADTTLSETPASARVKILSLLKTATVGHWLEHYDIKEGELTVKELQEWLSTRKWIDAYTQEIKEN